jgi:hypothetical protein
VRPIARVAFYAIPLALIGFGLLQPLVFTEVPLARAVISNADVTRSIDAEGHVTEAISGDFGPDMYGIVHYWNTAPTDVSALLDGVPVPLTLSAENGGDTTVAHIGDSHRYVDRGRHTFEVRYTTPEPDSRSATGERVLPGDRPSRGYAEPWVNATWYKGKAIVGESVAAMLAVAALTVAAAIAGYLWGRTTREEPPEFLPQFAPPAGLGPVQVQFIREKRGGAALFATFLYLADRRLIALKQVGSEAWTIQGLEGESRWAPLDPLSRSLGATLGLDRRGGEFTVDGGPRAGQRLKKAANRMDRSVRRWAVAEKLVTRTYSSWLVVALGVCALLVAIWVFLWGRGSAAGPEQLPATMWGLPFAVFFLATVRWWFSGIGFRRTSEGRDLWSRAEGFHRVLVEDSSETRLDFAAHVDRYTRYVPYAAAAGASELWAHKYAAATGGPAPQPEWYETLTRSRDHSGFGSLGSAIAASVRAAEPDPS